MIIKIEKTNDEFVASIVDTGIVLSKSPTLTQDFVDDLHLQGDESLWLFPGRATTDEAIADLKKFIALAGITLR